MPGAVTSEVRASAPTCACSRPHLLLMSVHGGRLGGNGHECWSRLACDRAAGTAPIVLGAPAGSQSALQAAGTSNVELRVDDLCSWQPDQAYDVVFFAFWLSHVPENHADRFWRNVHDALRPGGRFSSWMPHARSPRETSFTVRNCPIATARPSSGDSKTVARFESSSARSIPTGSREIFVNTALTRALSRQASSSSTDSADVPSPT